MSDSGLNEIKKRVSEQLGGMDVDNMSSDQVKNMLVNEINRNNDIDPAIKDKINRGDIEGLKGDLITYLSNNKSADGSSEQLINSLKSNDMDGLKKQLISMLISGFGPQKKNEIENQEILEASEVQSGEEAAQVLPEGGLGGLDEKVLLNLLFDKMFAGVRDDRRILLLNSVKPFVSDKRQKGIDDCIKIMNLVAFFENFMNKAGK